MDILRSISNGEFRPTRIMYAVNTSWRHYLDLKANLVAVGLVQEISKEKWAKMKLKTKKIIARKGLVILGKEKI